MSNVTIGMDLGDKKHQVCVLDNAGNVIQTCQLINNPEAIQEFYSQYPKAVVAIEAGTHSPWISRLLEDIVGKVLVGNPRKLRMIWKSDQKNDMRDAEMLARIARFDPNLLYPICHRGEQSQADRALLKARDILVKTRSSLITHVRGSVKSLGGRIAACSSNSFHKKAVENLPDILDLALMPLIEQIEELTKRIKSFDKIIEAISQKRYPETAIFRQVGGIGPVTALAFTVTTVDPSRFPKTRDVGPYLGMTPRRDQTGETDKQLHITKAGDGYLRKLLVQAANYILGPFGEDSHLRRFGLKKAESGGKKAKRIAVVAVARKLAVLLLQLWKTGEVYEPLYKPSVVTVKKAA